MCLQDYKFQSSECSIIPKSTYEFPIQPMRQPLEYFSKYTDEETFEDMTTFTNMRGVETEGNSFELNKREIMLFVGISILISIYILPRIKINWPRRAKIPVIADKISRNRNFLLRSNLKVVEDYSNDLSFS